MAVAERAWHKAAWELEYQPGVEYSDSTEHTDLYVLSDD